MNLVEFKLKDTEYTEKSYNDIEELRCHIIQQKTLKMALLMIDRINELNGYEVLGSYDRKVIERHYEALRKENVYRELQKGYMAMLSR